MEKSCFVEIIELWGYLIEIVNFVFEILLFCWVFLYFVFKDKL